MKSRICLIRHGITEGNLKRLYYGHSDIPLAEEGRRELKKLTGEGIYPFSEEADFYTTGLLRTEETLSIIYGDRSHDSIEELREMNFGDFEMKSHRQLKNTENYRLWTGDERGETAPPGGESINDFYARIQRGFKELRKRHALKELSMRHRGEDILSVVVCHGGTIAAILEGLFPKVKDNFFQWIPDPGHGYILMLENGEVKEKEDF
ncbi:MAG TPA: histidine phosphatase family protein [Candidatus Copromorpha excrementigallinarum]|uniref:Histidine phosphatase family protein n=1 Tax=Candidatus Allocopromorpha excrementigallinarum TaxID=2840742 RepID=A0A9D1I1R6_9FIRM|nr:histidine phosphatase family protein [Candidatus Copromorpha excrementigallinarum]